MWFSPKKKFPAGSGFVLRNKEGIHFGQVSHEIVVEKSRVVLRCAWIKKKGSPKSDWQRDATIEFTNWKKTISSKKLVTYSSGEDTLVIHPRAI